LEYFSTGRAPFCEKCLAAFPLFEACIKEDPALFSELECCGLVAVIITPLTSLAKSGGELEGLLNFVIVVLIGIATGDIVEDAPSRRSLWMD
jgi:hypothetical protein